MKSAGLLGTFTLATLIIAAFAISMPPPAVHAQSVASAPQVIITWKVIGGSAPAGYPGKVLPVQSSTIEAAVEVLDNGKFAPLGTQTVYWYLDDVFLDGGTGAQSVRFSAPGHNEIMSLRVQIPDLNGGLMNTSYIAMVDPQAVLVAPYPNDTFSGSSVSLQAVPYYFNPSDLGKLVYSWNVNGNAVAVQENPQVLNINLGNGTPAGYSLSVDLGLQVSGNPFLGAGKHITLTSIGQPASQ